MGKRTVAIDDQGMTNDESVGSDLHRLLKKVAIQ
jgi:hypothetical protein